MIDRLHRYAAALVLLMSAGCGHDAMAPQPGFVTAQAPQLAGLGGATVTPLLTTGDSLPSGYVMPPRPDGLGAYGERGAVVLFMNHELGGGIRDDAGALRFTGARISRLRLDPATATVL